MKPSTYQPIGHERLVSTGTGDMHEATIPKGTSAIEITVETTPARCTLTATGDPTTSTGMVVQHAQNPWFLPIGQGTTFRFASTGGTTSIVQLAYLQ